MYRTPQTHQQTVSVCHWEKEQTDRFQQESLPPTKLWMVPHCQTGLSVGKNAPDRCGPEGCSLHLKKKIFASVEEYSGVVSWAPAPLWMQPKRLLALPAQQSVLITCPLFSTCPCVINWIADPRINFFLQRLTLRLNILLIIPRSWHNKPPGTKQEAFFHWEEKITIKSFLTCYSSIIPHNSESKSLIFKKINYEVQSTTLQKWKLNFSEKQQQNWMYSAAFENSKVRFQYSSN